MNSLARGDPSYILPMLDCSIEDLDLWGMRLRRRFKNDIDKYKKQMEILRKRNDEFSAS